MSSKFRLTVLLTTLFFYHMMPFGSSTALAVPATPPLERVASLPSVTPSLPGESWSANTVTKDNIRWSFDKDYAVGQFVTGDWYVVAPSGMRVTAITAIGDDPLGGSMKNPAPVARQGYDPIHKYTEYATYDSSLNVGLQLPISLAPGDKLVSTTLYRYYGVTNPDGRTSATGLQEGAILTVLASTPPSGSFRPGLCDEDNVIYNESSIKYSLLSNLTPVSGAPSLSYLVDRFARPWIDHFFGWPGRDIHPHHNMQDYGGKLAGDLGKALLMVNCDFTEAEKRPIVIGLIQAGLDFYSHIKRNSKFYSGTPAHMYGRKLPVMFAGNLLNIAEIKAIWPKTGSYLHTTWGSYPGDAKIFSEDQLIEYVRQQDVDSTTSGTDKYSSEYNYTSAMIGMPEWFHQKYIDRSKGTPAWNVDLYRYTYESILGEVLAIRVMGWVSQWNNQAIFDYFDRYVAIAKGQPDPFGYTVPGEESGHRGYGGAIWNDNMWDKYRKDF